MNSWCTVSLYSHFFCTYHTDFPFYLILDLSCEFQRNLAIVAYGNQRNWRYKNHYQYFFCVSGVRLNPLGAAATSGLLYRPQMIDDGDYGAIDGMKIGRGNRSTRRKPAPEPHCPPQIPHDQTRARTQAAVVGSQQLTAWAMARPPTST
jgi:hypothetical protein